MESKSKKLQDKLKTLPRSPGVYFHKSKSGEIIYIGKAALLKNRVRQYFQSTRDMDIKTRALVEEIDDTDWVETESEIDALFLESEMVKRYLPRFNILLRDDKSQTFIRIDMKSQWPTVSFTRNPIDDNAEYFGPYYNGFAIKKALRYLRKVFPYYTTPPKDNGRPDLDAHIGLSPRPGTSQAEYKATLKRLIRYMEGGRSAILRELEKEMHQAAKMHDFETAARVRNNINDLRSLQHKIMFGDREFLDISKDKALTNLATLLGLSNIPVRIEGYDISHMGGTNVVASMVVFTNGVSDRANYRKFKTRIEQNDDYYNMQETLQRRLSEKNLKAWGKPDLILIDGGKGQLDAALKAVEAYHLNIPTISIAKREEEIIVHRTRSNIGTDTLIESMNNPTDDIAVTISGEYYIINLHVGQFNASSHSKNLRAATSHSKYTDVTKLFQRIRDESHRFAVSYHTVLKRAKQTANVLEEIPGVGPATRRKLIRTFGSMRGVLLAEESAVIQAIGKKKAKLILPIIKPRV
ncbi:MAG: excinuclease ABC subunit UvrC [Candidatus Microsaccharimonas sossegonensis]|uniref:Excinuclease ABC subunit UvrC n=1 Tax=Candidatus Microsaccharimonas sossegonensis TaxID=2506948 RepID=A0A4Q0AGG9_9BACT|nr:MAG: excinuclease ABC subunit UvrC [Candidatus Microsaccharimonas sossegonensis]